MYRLKLTLKNGKEFLSPFVYDLDEQQMKKKVNQMSWLCYKEYEDKDGKIQHKKVNDLTFFLVTNFPKLAVLDPDSRIWNRIEDTLEFIEMLEEKWYQLEY